MQDLIVQRPEGLYCPPGDFFIDPWRPVARAVITHAHADHARMGHGHYLAATPAQGVLRSRLGQDISLQTLDYGQQITHHGVALSLHPAGHVLGSAQVRLAFGGQTWVASGDYKVAPDATCAPFEPVTCDVFITESTFGLPIYRWRPDAELFAEINAWWAANAAAGRASVLMCYSFGKAQRILSGVDASIAPIVVHGAVQTLNTAYREAGVHLPDTRMVSDVSDPADFKRALVLCPPSAAGGPWIKRFGDFSDAFASGWMQLRGARRRGGYDKGFVLSDHADWPGLMGAIGATGAQRVIVTHGSVPVLVRYLTAQGLQAEAFHTEYGDDPVEEQLQATPGTAADDAVPAGPAA
ncbi:MAG: putative exonuclease, ligase-associated [Polaromonas sp.]|nr:putative exonuclease, ligase-associated [Polaromonas sp.]